MTSVQSYSAIHLRKKLARYSAGVIALLSSAASSLNAFAQDAAAPILTPGAPVPTEQLPGWTNYIFIGGMILFMWLFILRPQAKRQKEHKNFVESLSVGMEVITSGGLIGRITSVSETIVTLDLGNANVRALKSSVTGRLDGGVPKGLSATPT